MTIVKMLTHDDVEIAVAINGAGDTSRPVVACGCGRAFLLRDVDDVHCASKPRELIEIGYEARRATIEVVESMSFVVDGPPMTGRCEVCGADLDELARSGKVAHVSYGPGRCTSHDPES